MDNDTINIIKLCFDKSPEEAVKFLESKNIKVSWNWEKQLEIIRQHGFTVAKVTSADILQNFLDELNKALASGKTYDNFKKEMKEILDRKGYSKREDGTAWRLDTIYRTNLQSSYMTGRYYEMKEAEDAFPYWMYIAVMDSRTRPAHSALNGKVLKADDTFWSTSYPSNGFNCRCRVRSINDNYLKRKKKKVVNGGDLNFKPDKGFATNPTEQWKPDFKKYSPAIRKQLKKELA